VNAYESSKSKQIVLIVEDDDSIRETLRIVLETHGYSVSTAANGKEGIDLLLKTPLPCLILLDLMMPVMDGWSFVEALEQETALAAIPVVVVTAFSEAKRSIKAKEIIKKPVDIDLLLSVVKRYCGA
jgi:CheY-like chemotaxis protein